MSMFNVRAALVQAFVDGNFFPANAIAFENKKFNPPAGKPWAKLTFVPVQPVVATLGLEGRDRIQGFMQVDLNYLEDIGEAAILAKFEELRNTFTVGKRFAYDTDEVVIQSCGRSQGRIVNNYYRISVTVYFYSDIKRIN